MDSDKLLISGFSDRQRRCKDTFSITCTGFLDLPSQSAFLSIPGDREIKALLTGGYDGAERKIGVFIPAVFGIENEDDFLSYGEENPLCVLRINKDRFSSLSHRDYLGALMGCGLKREVTGDIITDENGAFLVLFKSVSEFVKRELTKIGRGSCKIESAEFSDICTGESSIKEKTLCVASLRLDNILSAAFSLSRKDAAEAISQKRVFVNDKLTEKSDFRVPVGAKIVLRGKGKAVLSEQRGTSKKNKPQIVIKKYM